MTYALCPYCSLPGLVTTVTVQAQSLDVKGQCVLCGYTCDSEYASADVTDDLPGEFTQPLDVTAAD